jgi:hypothetical protein
MKIVHNKSPHRTEDIMPGEVQQGNFAIPDFCIFSPLLESPSKENLSKLRKLGQRYDRLRREGQSVWSHFRDALGKALKERVRTARNALGYDTSALSPSERRQWRDTHHQEVVSVLEEMCQEFGWPTDYGAYIAPMFYDDSLEVQQACFKQLFTGGSMGAPFVSIAALTGKRRGSRDYQLVGPHSFALEPQLSEVGDVVIKLNLKTIAAKTLRQLESHLLLMKESLEAGKTYGSVLGRPTGYRKRVLDNLTWNEIALISHEDLNRFQELRQRYIEENLAKRKTEVWKAEQPDPAWLESERRCLLRNFGIQVRRAEKQVERE